MKISLKRLIPLLMVHQPKIPVEKLFFLNSPPREPNAKYIITADGIIEADKIIMA